MPHFPLAHANGDGVVVLNDSVSSFVLITTFIQDNITHSSILLIVQMPGGDAGIYSLGDTLTHEIGHWLGLYHTFQGGCGSSTGDYQHLVPDGSKTQESGATYYCPVNPRPDTCGGDGGSDPIQ